MREIVSDLRPRSSRAMNRVPIDFNDLLEEVLHLLRQEAESRQMQLRLDSASTCRRCKRTRCNSARSSSIWCAMRSTRMQTAHGSALGRYHDPGGQRGRRRVERARCRHRDCARGHEPLVRAVFHHQTNGMGIGLRLSQTIVETHGGRIGDPTTPMEPVPLSGWSCRPIRSDRIGHEGSHFPKRIAIPGWRRGCFPKGQGVPRQWRWLDRV